MALLSESLLWMPPNIKKNTVYKENVDRLASFIATTHYKLIYGINLATSTASVAADEVAYVAQALGSSLMAIEMGNEPDNYVTSGYFPDG